MPENLFTFPAYRNGEWIENNKKIAAPQQFLSNADITPNFIAKSTQTKVTKIKAKLVNENIRNVLFKQSIMQIQNVEVMRYKECREDRILKKILTKKHNKIFNTIYSGLMDRELIEKEVWEIDRCGKTISYNVMLYREGGDGFSSNIRPNSLKGLFDMFKFYYL